MARVLILQLAIFCSVLCVPVVADEGDVREALRTEIEQLRESGRLSIGGIDVASGNLLAEFYERRGFSPAWHGKSKVGALLDVIRATSADGLNPADYHLAKIEHAFGVLEGGRQLADFLRR